MSAPVRNQLATVRQARGIRAADLAGRVGVSRQTIYAIEAGTYVPNTEVALRLARELEVGVEAIFSLDAESTTTPAPITIETLGESKPREGQPVRISQVGSRWVGVPVSAVPYYLPEADGIVTQSGRRTSVTVFSKEDESSKRLVLAGCDPATGLLARMVEVVGGVEIVPAPASSKLALDWLKRDKVHIAGSHLEDVETGEFNLPQLRRQFRQAALLVVTFAGWEEGFVVTKSNPKSVNNVEHLARRDVEFVNREHGSGSRTLLDQLLHKAGIDPNLVRGYDRIAPGHLAAAYAVLIGEADCCIATRSAARAFGLDFIPIRAERYDFVLRKETMELPAAKVFLDVLQRASLRRKLETLAGYDTSRTGSIVG